MMITSRQGLKFFLCSLFVCAGCADRRSETYFSPASYRHSPDPTWHSDVADATSREAADLIDQAIARYSETVQGYRCILMRREMVKGRLTPLQTIDVCFRESPRSVRLAWLKKAGKVDRVAYVEGRDWNEEGEPCALVRPTNRLVRWVAGDVAVPVHGEKARESSRHTVDDFGFGYLLGRIRDLNELAERRGHLELRMLPDGEVDGRATKVIQRRLPQMDDYPDSQLIMHIDQESLLPVHFETYADPHGRQLLGLYIFTDVRINPEFCEADFEL